MGLDRALREYIDFLNSRADQAEYGISGLRAKISAFGDAIQGEDAIETLATDTATASTDASTATVDMEAIKARVDEILANL